MNLRLIEKKQHRIISRLKRKKRDAEREKELQKVHHISTTSKQYPGTGDNISWITPKYTGDHNYSIVTSSVDTTGYFRETFTPATPAQILYRRVMGTNPSTPTHNLPLL